jgi:endonuclease/exonuclease/phosphatase family metal-dependent hydrolase
MQPDIVCLQELDQSRTRSGDVDQVEEIARQLSTDYEFHAVTEVDDGRFGNAVLTTYPMRLVASGPLPRIQSRIALEDRGVVWVAVEMGGRRVNVINTHLSIHRGERRIQVEALVEEWLRHPDRTGPTVLTGDFNTSGTSPTGRRIGEVLRDVEDHHPSEPVLQTWSSRLPLRRIDHVYVSEEFTVRGIHVPQTRLSRVASDHLPLVVDLSCCLDAEVTDERRVTPARRTG